LTCVPKTVSTRTPQVSTLEQSGNPIPALLGQETAAGRAKIQNTIEFFVFQAPKIFQQKLQKYWILILLLVLGWEGSDYVCAIECSNQEYLSSTDNGCRKMLFEYWKGPGSTILDAILWMEVDFGAWQFSRRRKIDGQFF
jgi:hypothetical protein